MALALAELASASEANSPSGRQCGSCIIQMILLEKLIFDAATDLQIGFPPDLRSYRSKSGAFAMSVVAAAEESSLFMTEGRLIY